MIYLLFAAVIFLAFSNGANDNFKGVSTLFGTGTSNYKSSLAIATVFTLAGSICSIYFAEALVKNFSGKGLIQDEFLSLPAFAFSVALGAASTVMLATRLGMPVSTTHGLVGALTGVGLVIAGVDFNFSKLGTAFFLPLILSPLAAALISLILYLIFSNLRKRWNIQKNSCLCIRQETAVASPVYASNYLSAAVLNSKLEVKAGNIHTCAETYSGNLIGLSAQSILNASHYVSAAAVSFARGLNDTPKIAGLLIMFHIMKIEHSMGLLALFIALGGLLNARKVAETMSKKITSLNHGQGFTANLVTALLVCTASWNGLPVSTTHVSVGSLFGIGSVSKKANKKVIVDILFSWLLTLPIAGLLGASFYLLILNC